MRSTFVDHSRNRMKAVDLILFDELGKPIKETAEFLCRNVAECEARLVELKAKT